MGAGILRSAGLNGDFSYHVDIIAIVKKIGSINACEHKHKNVDLHKCIYLKNSNPLEYNVLRR
jgi:hypothetical protein